MNPVLGFLLCLLALLVIGSLLLASQTQDPKELANIIGLLTSPVTILCAFAIGASRQRS